ncbi:M1 family aminopeptidase [Tepidiforma sp.]|uniref:M1 family aminopeptidase n=1 Tax=Tepidiforma sp. TaxID=2682230 RepID=UPI002ADDB167|nr:M1 family aminopeptidase [Tepidiforma sp.]
MTLLYGERLSCGRLAVDEPRAPAHALPGDRPVWPRDRVVDIEHVKIEVRLEPADRRVRGSVTHTVRLLNDGTRYVPFDAVEMAISGVQVAKQAAPFEYDGARLVVDIGEGRKRGQELAIAISYEAQPRIGMYFIAPDAGYPDKPVQVWTQCQDEDTRYWLPCFDHPSDKFTSDVAVTVPGNWFALSNGRLLQEKANRDGTRTFHWHQDRPHPAYLLTIAAGEFVRVEGRAERFPVDYYVEPKDEEAARRTFANTPAMIDLFERLLGTPYPWAKYSQVVVRDFVFGGMENTSATTMTENILLDAKAARDFDSDGLISHELAHQWFGDLLTCRDWSHGWLNEGFATYLELLWDEHHRGIDWYRQGVAENTQLYLEERYRRPIVTNVFRDPIDIFDRHLYEKGSLVLHMLRGVLGDAAFLRSIQRYVREHAEQNVITQDLVDAIAAETGRNLEWFFDQWVYRPGHPKLKVSWSWDDDAKLATVTVKQTQDRSDGTALFRLPVTIDFRKGRGRPQSFRVEISEAEHTFAFPLAAKPDLCRFDPGGWVLKELEWDKSVGELRLQLRDDDDVLGREWAAAQLGKKGGAEATAALEAAVLGDRFWGVQAAAAKALGEIRTTAARDALLRCLKVRQPRARRAVVAALGQFRGDEAVLEALTPFARRDSSWFVEAETCRSIGKLRLPGSFAVLAQQFDRPSFRQVVRVGCIDGLVELRDERGFELLRRAAAYGQPFQARPPAVGAMARLGAFFPERKKPLAEEIAGFLEDPDFRVRVAAANALKSLREASQAAALERMAARELDGRGVRAAREAALALRKGSATDDELKKLREEFEKLRDENSRLRDRLERLEARA